MDEYTKKIVYYMNNQKYVGKLENYTHVLNLKSKACGDWNDIYLEVKDDLILNISYENSGCSLNIAALEIICEYLLNKNINEINNLNFDFIRKELDFPENKKHCISLTIDCLSEVFTKN